MKKIMIIFILLISISFVYSLDVPSEPDTVLINKISNEHKTTRQFFENELNEREKNFLDEFTSRADYYEESYESIMKTTLLKLIFVWAGIFILFVSINQLLRNKLEKKKYNLLKDAIKTDIITELKKELLTLPEKEMKISEEIKIKERKSDFARKFIKNGK